MALQSNGVYHDDDLTHLQFARWAWTHPGYLLDAWGRPGFTVLYAAPAKLGWTAARLFSGVLTGLTAWFAYCIGRRLGVRHAWIVPALLWLQPLVFSLSYTTLTEPVMAFYLSGAMLLLMRGRRAASAAVLSLCLVTRHEAAVLLPVWAAAIWIKRGRAAGGAGGLSLTNFRRCLPVWALLLWAPAVHNLLAWLALDAAPSSLYLQPRPTDFYGAGGWLTMFVRWIECSGAPLIMLAFAGAVVLWRSADGRIWLACGAAYLAAHVLLHRFGLFATGGYARFLVAIGPVVAVSAGAAVSGFVERAAAVWHRLPARDAQRAAELGGHRPIGCATPEAPVRSLLAAVAAGGVLLWLSAEAVEPRWLWAGLRWPVLMLAAAGILLGRVSVRPVAVAATMACPAWLLWTAFGQPLNQCSPHRLTEDQLLIRQAADWIRAAGLAERRIVSANSWVPEFLNLTRTPDAQPPRIAFVHSLRTGDLFVWDARYCPGLNELPLSAVRERGDLVELWHGDSHSIDGVYCYVFEKRGERAGNRTRP